MTGSTSKQGLVAGLIGIVLAILGTVFGLHLTPAYQNAIYVAAAFVAAIVLYLFHIAASSAVTEGLPTVDFHSQAFWIGLFSAVITLLVVVFHVKLTPTNQHLFLSAALIVVSIIYGLGRVTMAGMTAMLQRAPASPPPRPDP